MGFLYIKFLFAFKGMEEILMELTWKEESCLGNNRQTQTPE